MQRTIRAACPLQNTAGGLGADEGLQGEGVGDVVAEGVGGVGAGGVGFIEFGGDGAGVVGGPGDLFEILDEFATVWIDEKVGVIEGVAEAAVDGIDAVADGWVGGSNFEKGLVGADPLSEELSDDGPIGSGGGGALFTLWRR